MSCAGTATAAAEKQLVLSGTFGTEIKGTPGRAPGGDPSYGRREWLRKRAFGVTTMRPQDAL